MRGFGLALAGCVAVSVSMAETGWREQAVIHVASSPHVRLRPVPVRAVKLGSGFLETRRKVNAGRSIPALLDLLEEHGIVDNFRRLSGRKQAPRRGPLYTDSDLYKWIEAAAWVLHSEDNPPLRTAIQRVADEILAAQEPDGYLNTYYVEERAGLRFTEMQRSHELYCLGHLIQAAVALYRAVGDRRLLDAGIRFAGYLARDFGPQKRPLLTGHPELEMALVELYRTTGERRYLDLAGYLLGGVERERLKLRESDLRYMFSGKPFTSRTVLEGHAVRAMYASCGAADYLAETGDPAYAATLETLWRDMAGAKMYLTGGVGSRAQGEAFGEPFELPNQQAYTESCAAIANLMWNFRLLALRGEERFAAVVERALYNGIASGVSLDGLLYCYRNPLESAGEKIRNPWYDTTCCPPNIQRLLASLPGYFYSTSSEGLYVHLFHSSRLDWRLESGAALTVVQKTQYPWEGTVDFEISPAAPVQFALFVRIPGWSLSTAVTVNGRPMAGAARAGSYLPLRRLWRPGDRVRVAFDFQPRLVSANPRVAENNAKAALQRGPLVYCLERPDLPAGLSVFDVLLNPRAPLLAKAEPGLLGGVTALLHDSYVRGTPSASAPLYGWWRGAEAPRLRPLRVKLIPYYAWANRGESEMRVWLPVGPAAPAVQSFHSEQPK